MTCVLLISSSVSFFLFKQKTGYELRISDWSSDVCSSDLGGLVAVIGFADDHGHIAARWRLLGHFVAALWALYWLNGLPPVVLFGITVDMEIGRASCRERVCQYV